MFLKVSPESVGVKSAWVERFLTRLNQKGYVVHDVLMMRGEKIFCEAYWKPFHKDFCHRQYSQTKSFVAVAIGLLEEEGKLSLDDPIISFFPDKIDGPVPAYLQKQTVRDMLTMTTACQVPYWFGHPDRDRVHLYLNKSKVIRPAGSVWEYDSAGSQVLCVLVERLTGKTMLEYLKEKIFNEIGSFQTAQMLKTPSGESWGDSAMVCTARDMLSFGRFVMNYGTWNGKRLMNEAYLKEATSMLVDNRTFGHGSSYYAGYGYQIWRHRSDSFGFVGMGQQLTLCNPEKDLIFVINADMQGARYGSETTFDLFFDEVADRIGENSLPEDPQAQKRLENLCENLSLYSLQGAGNPARQDWLNGKVFETVAENPMGIRWFSFAFDEPDSGVLHYENAQGTKQLPFKLNGNAFGKFPQLGYSNDVGGERTKDGFMYNCAVSAAWRTENRLQIFVQIIDRYFGNATMNFTFLENMATVNMERTAEDFLEEYQGEAVAVLKSTADDK